MLFNVFYEEASFPLLQEVKYIKNCTTGDRFTIEEFLDNLDNYDETNYIVALNVFFPFLEKALLEAGYRCKATQTPHYSNYTSKIAGKHMYVADITSNGTGPVVNRMVSKVRIGCLAGQRYFVNFTPYTTYHSINTPMSPQEIEFAAYLSSIDCRSGSPSGALKEEYRLFNSKPIFHTDADVSLGFSLAARDTCYRPAVMEAYEPGYHAEG